MAKLSINLSATLLAAIIIITFAATISIIIMSYKFCSSKESIPTTEIANCNVKNEKANQNLTLEAKMAYFRNLSLEANLPQLNSTEMCETEECFEAAQDLLYTMDGKMDPCVNFYKFACGRNEVNKQESLLPPKEKVLAWNKTALVLEILQKENETDLKPLNQAKLFYKQCMELDECEGKGLEVLKELIKTYGGWPLLEETWNGSDFNWIEMAGELDSGIESVIISVSVWIDQHNSSRHAIYLGYGSFGVPERALRDPVKYSKIITAYEQFAYNILNELGYTVNQTDLRKSVREMIYFEIKLAQLITFKYDGLSKSYKLSELENITGIEWSVYFNKYFSASDINVDGNEEILVEDINYFKGLKNLLESEEIETIANHFIWRIVANLAEFSNKRFRKMRREFTEAVEGWVRKGEKLCADLTRKAFDFAIGAKYLESNMEWITEIKKDVEKFAEEIKTSFIEIVGEANWIGEETKANAIEKIEGIRAFIGYPEWLLNGSEVEKYYDGIELGESYIESELKLRFWQGQRWIMKLRKVPDRNEWRGSVWENNAWFYQQLNAITIPFMKFLPPNFGVDRPQHQNFARLGRTLGHEMTHAFDNTGRLYDKDGNMRNWWNEESKSKFEKKMECITKQYDKWWWRYPTNMGLNGEMTLGENMADIGGLQISFRAYQNHLKKYGEEKRLPGLESYTPEQLYFIANANGFCGSETNTEFVYSLLTDSHSPDEIRAQEPFKNSEAFRKAFNCEEKGNYEMNATSRVKSCDQLW